MTLKTLAPILTTDDIDPSVRFYVDVLGFTCGMQTPGYASLCRDEVRIMLATPNGHGEWKGPKFTGQLATKRVPSVRCAPSSAWTRKSHAPRLTFMRSAATG